MHRPRAQSQDKKTNSNMRDFLQLFYENSMIWFLISYYQRLQFNASAGDFFQLIVKL